MPEYLRFPDYVGGGADGQPANVPDGQRRVRVHLPAPGDVADYNVADYRLELLALPEANVVVEVWVTDSFGERTVGHGTVLAAIARRACR